MSSTKSKTCYLGHPDCCFTVQQLDEIAFRTAKFWKRILIHLKVPYYYIENIEADASNKNQSSEEAAFKGYLKWYQMSPNETARCRLKEVLVSLEMLDVLEDLEAKHQNEGSQTKVCQSKLFIDVKDDGSCIGREKELKEILKFALDESCEDKHLVIVAIPGLGKQELFKQALSKICRKNRSKIILFPTLYPTSTEEKKDYTLENLLGNLCEEIRPGVCPSKNRKTVVTQLLSDISEPTILALDVSSVNMPYNEIKLLFQFIDRVLSNSSNLKIIHLRCKSPDFDVNAKQLLLTTIDKESSIELLKHHNSHISRDDCIRIFNCCGGYPYMLRKFTAHINNFTVLQKELDKFINKLEENPDREHLNPFLTKWLKDDLKTLFEQLDGLEQDTLIQLAHFSELIPIEFLDYIFHSAVGITAGHLWSHHAWLERSTCTRYYQMGTLTRKFIEGYCKKTEQNSKLFMQSKLEVIRYYLKILKELSILFFDPSSMHSASCQQLRKMIKNYIFNCNKCHSKCACEISTIIISLFQRMKPNIISFLKKGFFLEETIIETVDTCCRTVHLLQNLLPLDELESLYITNYGKVLDSLQSDVLRLANFKATLVFIRIYQHLKQEQDRNINDLTQVIQFMKHRIGQLNSSMLHQLSLCYINRGYLRGFASSQFNRGIADINYGSKLLKKLPKKGRFLVTEYSYNGYLAAIYYQQQLFKQSIEKRNLQIDGYRKHLGNHAFTAKALHYQAQAYFKINEYEKSIKCCWDSYNIYCKLRCTGAETMRVLPTLAKNLIKTGNIEQGLDKFRQAITEGKNALGEHERVAWCYKELATNMQATNKDPHEVKMLNEKAEDIMKQYRKICNIESKGSYVFQYSIREIDLSCFGYEDRSCSYFKYFIPIPVVALILYYFFYR